VLALPSSQVGMFIMVVPSIRSSGATVTENNGEEHLNKKPLLFGSKVGYQTSYASKYLSTYGGTPSGVPVGWDRCSIWWETGLLDYNTV